MATEITVLDDEGEELVYVMPSVREKCHECEASGFVLNPSMRDVDYTPEEFNEEFSDEGDEFDDEDGELVVAGSERSQYFKRGGIYDVVCPSCKGAKEVDVVDESALNPAQKTVYERFLSQEEDRASFDAESAAERRMGA